MGLKGYRSKIYAFHSVKAINVCNFFFPAPYLVRRISPMETGNVRAGNASAKRQSGSFSRVFFFSVASEEFYAHADASAPSHIIGVS